MRCESEAPYLPCIYLWFCPRKQLILPVVRFRRPRKDLPSVLAWLVTQRAIRYTGAVVNIVGSTCQGDYYLRTFCLHALPRLSTNVTGHYRPPAAAYMRRPVIGQPSTV